MSNWTPDQWQMFFIYAGGFGTVIATQITGIIVSFGNRKHVIQAQEQISQTKNQLVENTAITREVHSATNGKMDSLVDAVNVAAAAAKAAAEIAEKHANKQDVEAAKPAVVIQPHKD